MSSILGKGIYGQCPFTGVDIASAHNEITLVAFSKAAAEKAHTPIGNWTNTGSPAAVAVAQNVAATSAASALCWATGMSTSNIASLAADTDRENHFEMVAGVFTASVGVSLAYRARTGLSPVTGVGTPTAMTGFGGPNPIRLGFTAGSYTDSSPEIAGAFIYNRALTQAELAYVQSRATAIFGAYGLTV